MYTQIEFEVFFEIPDLGSSELKNLRGFGNMSVCMCVCSANEKTTQSNCTRFVLNIY